MSVDATEGGSGTVSPVAARRRPRGLSGDAAEGVRAWVEGREEVDSFLFGRSKSDSLVAVPPNLASD